MVVTTCLPLVRNPLDRIRISLDSTQSIYSAAAMSDIFRKSVLNRLPAMPPPTKAPWVMDDEELEELEDEQDGLSALPAESSKKSVRGS